MEEHHDQVEIPASFVALYVPEGRIKPIEPRHVIAARYELCEDMANHLFEFARARHFDLGISEDEVLIRCHRGLLSDGSGFNLDEARWVIRRLAELLGWACPPEIFS
jgi:hypothetical protein